MLCFFVTIEFDIGMKNITCASEHLSIVRGTVRSTCFVTGSQRVGLGIC